MPPIEKRARPFLVYLEARQRLINRALDRRLPPASRSPRALHEAMRYSTLSSGKRIRSLLTLAATEAVGGRIQASLPAACAIEMIHAYSLIHDDLPAMDNADARRGQPSCHKKFGEAVALLAGDALLTLSFELLAQTPPARQRQEVITEIARAAGTSGMIGGQAIEFLPHRRDRRMFREIAARKTGALIACAVRVGALFGEASRQELVRLERYGQRIGLAFQLVDDLLDRDGQAKLAGEVAARREVQRLIASAKEALAPFGSRGIMLSRLADYIVHRRA